MAPAALDEPCHVVDLVTRLIWAAVSGMVREAGIEADPDQPLPGANPSLMRFTGDRPGRLMPD